MKKGAESLSGVISLKKYIEERHNLKARGAVKWKKSNQCEKQLILLKYLISMWESLRKRDI